MKLKPETTGFIRGGSLYLEPPAKWRVWQRDVWTCCSSRPVVRSVWHCRGCGGRTVCAGVPNFCSGCRAARSRLHLVATYSESPAKEHQA